MPTVSASGTQTAVVGTEHTLFNPTTNKWFSGYIDVTNMVSGDIVELRVYAIVKTAGSYILYSLNTLTDAQTLDLYHVPSFPSDIGFKVTLKQTAGTARTYDWKFYEV